MVLLQVGNQGRIAGLSPSAEHTRQFRIVVEYAISYRSREQCGGRFHR